MSLPYLKMLAFLKRVFTKSKPVKWSFKNNSITHSTKTEWQPIIRRRKSSRMMHNLQRMWFYPLWKEMYNNFPPRWAVFAGGPYHLYGFSLQMRFIVSPPQTVKESLWTQRIWWSQNAWNFNHLWLPVKRQPESSGEWTAHVDSSWHKCTLKAICPPECSTLHRRGKSEMHKQGREAPELGGPETSRPIPSSHR